MADHRSQKRRQKALQRKKKKRARASRPGRDGPTAGKVTRDPSVGAHWPIGECYLGDGWYERGAHVHAVFTRRSADGQVAAAFFEVDLAERGVVEATSFGNGTDANVQAELVRRSTDEQALATSDPDRVAKLVTTAAAFGAERGHPLPAGYARAIGVFGDLDPDTCRDDILCGAEPEPEPKPPSLFARLKGRFS